jgi:predicted hydrocarbon binding protein
LGDPYCELKLIAGEIGGLKSSLEKDSYIIEKIHERLIERLVVFLLDGKPIVERPMLGSDIQLHAVWHAMGVHPPGGERYKMALRMGGAKSGKAVGERMLESGFNKDEAIRRVINFMEYCKVGKITGDETIRIRESCESSWTRLFGFPTEPVEPSCFFTTGFLNGLFSAVKNRHVREVKCIAVGDTYCEWEIV